MVGTTTSDYLKEHPVEKHNLELTQRELLVKILDTLESLKRIAEEEASYKMKQRSDTTIDGNSQSKYYY